MKHLGSIIKLRPEYEERYIILHKHVFPEVLDRIVKSNIRNYSIFLRDRILFSHLEYVGKDYDADMKAMADDRTTQDWWKLTDPMQEPFSSRKEGEWWMEMEEVYHKNTEENMSPVAGRICLTAEVGEGKEHGIVENIRNERLRDFRNFHVYCKAGKLFLYREYGGNDLAFGYRDKLDSFLIEKENAKWHIMKEVFHLD